MTLGLITVSKDREKPVRNQHPWIFSGAIASAQHVESGELVTVQDSKGNFLARGFWNQKSQIQVRIMTWHDETIDELWWRKSLHRAIEGRLITPNCAVRLIHAESDYIPGLIADLYGQYIVIQALTLYIDRNKKMIAQLLAEVFNSHYPQADQRILGVLERSDADVRGKEGLRDSVGTIWGETVPQSITIQENNAHYTLNPYTGHKTGFYLDQRPNRLLVQELVAQRFGSRPYALLNLFSYTGGFGISALGGTHHNPQRGDVRVVNVDASADALNLAKNNYALNMPTDVFDDAHQPHIEYVQADCFDYLRQAMQEEEEFDIVVCDPPKFAQNAQQVDKAARGYKDLNLNAFKLIKSGGYLLTFSCSGAISQDLFQKIVFGALADSGRQAQILQQLGAGDDHPIAITFPEGQYLKGFLLRVY